jgi:toxin YoeB
MILLAWTPKAWEDYLYWQEQDKAKSRRINMLINSALRNPFKGEGKPEPLRFQLAGLWSRRIDQEHRLVYNWKVVSRNFRTFCSRHVASVWARPGGAGGGLACYPPQLYRGRWGGAGSGSMPRPRT